MERMHSPYAAIALITQPHATVGSRLARDSLPSRARSSIAEKRGINDVLTVQALRSRVSADIAVPSYDSPLRVESSTSRDPREWRRSWRRILRTSSDWTFAGR